VVAAVLAVVVAIAILWPLTPSVADAPHRVRADIGPHGSQLLPALPHPDRVARAIIATENSRFYVDPGVDPVGLLRAAEGVVLHRNVGASTLEQQLAKRLYTPADASVWPKVEDVELSFKLDLSYSKDDVLRMYLSDVYFGHNSYGVTAAAEKYFGRRPTDLSWAQASLLAGLVQAPTAYNPYEHPAAAKARQRHVLDRLVATGVLSRQQADAAYAAPLHLR
jgi:penicillin-binding protein 1A